MISRRTSFRPRPLSIFKRIPLIRDPEELKAFDEHGNKYIIEEVVSKLNISHLFMQYVLYTPLHIFPSRLSCNVNFGTLLNCHEFKFECLALIVKFFCCL